MALITTIDCERVVPNRFELVLLAAARARALSRGDIPHVPPDGDKSTVTALREIAAGTIDPIRLRLRQQMLKLKGDDVEEHDEPDRPSGTAGSSAKEPSGAAGTVAAESTTRTACHGKHP